MPSAKRRTSDLSVLLKALSDNLREDSAGSQVADHVNFLSRLRAVIPKLLDAFVDPRHVKEREMRSVLGLFDMALLKHPATFYNGAGTFTVHTLGRLLPLLASTRLSTTAYDALMKTVFGLLSLLSMGNIAAYCLVLQGAVELLADLNEVATLMAGDAQHLPAVTSVYVHAFGAAMALQAEQPAVDLDGTPPPELLKEKITPGLLLDISGERWRPLAAASMQILEHGMSTCVPVTVSALTPSTAAHIAQLLPLLPTRNALNGYGILRLLVLEVHPAVFPAEDVLSALLAATAPSSGAGSGDHDMREVGDVGDAEEDERLEAVGRCLTWVTTHCRDTALHSVSPAVVAALRAALLRPTAPRTLKADLCRVTAQLLNVVPAAAPPVFAALRPALGAADLTSYTAVCLRAVLHAAPSLLHQPPAAAAAAEPPSTKRPLSQPSPPASTRKRSRRQKEAPKGDGQAEDMAVDIAVGALAVAAMTEKTVHTGTAGVGHAVAAATGAMDDASSAVVDRALEQRLTSLIDELIPPDGSPGPDVVKGLQSRLASLSVLAQAFTTAPRSVCGARVSSQLRRWAGWWDGVMGARTSESDGKGARSVRGATASASDPTAFAAVFCREPLLLKLLLDAFVAMPAASLAAATYTLPWSAAFDPAAAEAAAAVSMSVEGRPNDDSVRLAVKAGVLKLALAAPPAPPADADAALNAALADSDPRVRAAAAATAPYICLAACDAARQQAALTRMKDILEQLGADSSLLVLRSVAASLGPTLCLAAHALDATHPSPATHPPSVSAFSSYTSNIAAELAAAAAAAIASTVTISGSTRSASTDAHDWCAACDQADALAHGHASSSTSSSSSSSHPPVSSTDASGGSAGARLAQACWQLAVRLLTHDEELVKAACLGSLGRMATHAALAPPDRDRVGEAATPISTSLSEQPAREAAMHMVVAHLAHESPDIRHAAGEALVRLAQPRALEALYGVQRGEEMEQHAVLHGIRGVIEEARVMGDGSVRTAAVALLERVGVGGGSGDGGVRASSNRTIIVMITAVQRLDDPDWSVRAAALDLIASLARRCGLSVLGLVMDTKQLLMYLGLQLIARPLLTVVLAEALCGCTQQELLVYVLSSALPTLVAKKDEAMLAEFAMRLGKPDVQQMLHEYVHYFFADLLTSDQRPEKKHEELEYVTRLAGYADSPSLIMKVMPDLVLEVVTKRVAQDFGGWAEENVDTVIDDSVKHLMATFDIFAEWSNGGSDSQERRDSVMMDAGDGGDTTAVSQFLQPYMLVLLKSASATLTKDGSKPKGGAMEGVRALAETGHGDATQRAVYTLAVVIDLAGAGLKQYVPQVMAVLSLALGSNTALTLALTAMRRFVARLACIAPRHLCQVANQIVVLVLPHLGEVDAAAAATAGQDADKVTAQAVMVLTELVLKHQSVLRRGKVLNKLPMMPALASLRAVNAILEEERGTLPLPQRLLLLTESLEANSLAVRLVALKQLQMLARQQRAELYAFFLQAQPGGGDAAAAAVATVSKVYSVLLQCCCVGLHTMQGKRVLHNAVVTLGELGAADPARLQVRVPPPPPLLCSQLEFARTLLTEHLVRVLTTASDLEMLDAASYSIQELLKACDCRLRHGKSAGPVATTTSGPPRSTRNTAVSPPDELGEDGTPDDVEVEGEGLSFWMDLPAHCRDVIAPCLNSGYVMRQLVKPASSVPIFSHNRAWSFRQWLNMWCRHLLSSAGGPRAVVLHACQGVLRHDTGTQLFLLPYFVHAAVCYGTPEAREHVRAEILAVLEEAAHTRPSSPSQEGTAASTTTTSTNRTELSAQAVFTLLDQLTRWAEQQMARGRKGSASGSGSGGGAARSKDDTTSMGTGMTGMTGTAGPGELTLSEGTKDELAHMWDLLQSIPKPILARAAFELQAHARALMYFEAYMRARPGGGALNPAASGAQHTSARFDDKEVSLLGRIYRGLEEPDHLSGLYALRQGAGPSDEVLSAEQNGRWWDALTLYELKSRAPAHEGGEEEEGALSEADAGRLQCLLRSGHLHSVLQQVHGLCESPQYGRCPRALTDLRSYGVAAAWRLGQWDDVDMYLPGGGTAAALASSAATAGPLGAIELSVGQALSALRGGSTSKLHTTLQAARMAIQMPLSAAGMESYARAYPHLLSLHLLQELETAPLALQAAASTGHATDGGEAAAQVLRAAQWVQRQQLTQVQSLWTCEPLLAMRRQIYLLAGCSQEAGLCQLAYAKACRRAGHHDAAALAVLEACAAGVPGAPLERAKLMWQLNDPHQALSILQEVAAGARTAAAAGDSPPAGVGKALLRMAIWAHSTGLKEKSEAIKMFQTAISSAGQGTTAVGQGYEKAHFHFARYLDDVMQHVAEAERATTVSKSTKGKSSKVVTKAEEPSDYYLLHAVKNYVNGLKYGHTKIYVALPRLLTLWFDYKQTNTEKATSSKDTPTELNQTVELALKQLPTYQWYTALPQLTSRINHPDEAVRHLLKRILVRVVTDMPHQALWTMAAVLRSKDPNRTKAASEVLMEAKRGSTEAKKRLRELIAKFSSLQDALMKLCDQQPPQDARGRIRPLSLKTHCASLSRMLPVSVMVPVQSALMAALPADGCTAPSHQAFGATHVSIRGIEDTIEVLPSLQRPKKIAFLGSDGRAYTFLAKPKDDLRKDTRMMEFNALLNRILAKSPASRRRNLYIRTFTVIPLSEDCGLVEWVPNTRGIRHILQDLYENAGLFVRRGPQATHTRIKQIYDKTASATDRMSQVLSMLPPIFHQHFLQSMPEPGAWARARTAFAHTAGVWSMVGHIVGLGDRHGENILIDGATGDCVHVDFSCLFDKGLDLELPELVPFRCTQNMVDGMGVSGVEGVFLSVCEIVLDILRSNRETLMTVLETFVHDPLVEWTKQRMYAQQDDPQLFSRSILQKIRGRLEGRLIGVGSAASMQLAPRGHARRLVEEATAWDRLGKMYIWWMAWL